MKSNSGAPVLEMNGKEKEMVHQKKWTFNWFLKFCRVSDDQTVAGGLFHDTGPVTANCTITKVGLWMLNLEIGSCCQVKSRMSSVFSVWSAELTEIFCRSAMDSFEDFMHIWQFMHIKAWQWWRWWWQTNAEPTGSGGQKNTWVARCFCKSASAINRSASVTQK